MAQCSQPGERRMLENSGCKASRRWALPVLKRYVWYAVAVERESPNRMTWVWQAVCSEHLSVLLVYVFQPIFSFDVTKFDFGFPTQSPAPSYFPLARSPCLCHCNAVRLFVCKLLGLLADHHTVVADIRVSKWGFESHVRTAVSDWFVSQPIRDTLIQGGAETSRWFITWKWTL